MGIQTRYRAVVQHNSDLTLLIMDLVNQLGGNAVVPSISQMDKLYEKSYLQDEILAGGEHRLSLASVDIGSTTYS